MTMSDLLEYRLLQRELKQAESSLARLVKNKDQYVLHDTVEASSKKTLKKVLVPVIGHSPEYVVTYRQRKESLTARIKQCSLKLAEIDKFIKTVDKSEIRQIIEWRVIEGCTWNRTSCRVFGYPCGDRARRALERYLQKK